MLLTAPLTINAVVTAGMLCREPCHLGLRLELVRCQLQAPTGLSEEIQRVGAGPRFGWRPSIGCLPTQHGAPSQPLIASLSLLSSLPQAAEPLAGLDRKTERFLAVSLSGGGLIANFMPETTKVGAARVPAAGRFATAGAAPADSHAWIPEGKLQCTACPLPTPPPACERLPRSHPPSSSSPQVTDREHRDCSIGLWRVPRASSIEGPPEYAGAWQLGARHPAAARPRSAAGRARPCCSVRGACC